MPASGILLVLFTSSPVFIAPQTMEWKDDLCQYRGTFDAARISPEILQNTVELTLKGPALFADAREKPFEVHADFSGMKEKYQSYARYTQAIDQMKSAYQSTGDASELKKPVLGRPPRPLCDRFVDLLAESDLSKKLRGFLQVYPQVCRAQGGLRKDCEHAARVHVQNWTSIAKANLSLVGTDWNNCMIHYDEIHQLPQPEIAGLFQSIEAFDCAD